MLPISRDTLDGPAVLANLAEVYALTDESDPAFETMNALEGCSERTLLWRLKVLSVLGPATKGSAL